MSRKTHGLLIGNQQEAQAGFFKKWKIKPLYSLFEKGRDRHQHRQEEPKNDPVINIPGLPSSTLVLVPPSSIDDNLYDQDRLSPDRILDKEIQKVSDHINQRIVLAEEKFHDLSDDFYEAAHQLGEEGLRAAENIEIATKKMGDDIAREWKDLPPEVQVLILAAAVGAGGYILAPYIGAQFTATFIIQGIEVSGELVVAAIGAGAGAGLGAASSSEPERDDSRGGDHVHIQEGNQRILRIRRAPAWKVSRTYSYLG